MRTAAVGGPSLALRVRKLRHGSKTLGDDSGGLAHRTNPSLALRVGGSRSDALRSAAAGRAAWPRTVRTLTRSASDGVRKPRVSVQPQRAASVSLTMIVKNEQENLPTCLASVEGIFDEIVVVDTGSTDRTKEIAREFGAKVFDFEWIDNFAAARNEALSHATGDYAFWLDADDVVEPEQREKLVALLAGLKRPMPSPCSGIACGSAGSTPLAACHQRMWFCRVHPP